MKKDKTQSWFTIIIGILLLLPFQVNAQIQVTNPMADPNSAFIENNGQIVDQDLIPNPAVLFLMSREGMNVQLRKGGFSYDLYRVDPAPDQHAKSPEEKDHSVNLNRDESTTTAADTGRWIIFHRIDVNLLNADTTCEIVRSAPSGDYWNYYTPGMPAGGVKEVRSYRQITYRNIYPGIDLECLADEESRFKYTFFVSPGGKTEDILFRIDGPDIEVTSEGSLILRTAAGTIIEEIPMSFIIHDGIRIPVNVSFVKAGKNSFGLKTDQQIDPSDSLIIDPTPRRLWGTYYGGTNAEVASDLTMDLAGNMYLCGNTLSTNNIATAGTYQSTKNGIYDSFLVRFDQSGQRHWGTYYGGAFNENYEACVCDQQGNIYLSGRTSSQTGISTPGSHQPLFGGGTSDNYLAKFDSAGQLIWATYYGGSVSENSVDCSTDDSLNVYLCGSTSSSDNISTPGAHQTTNHGSIDAYLVKFDSNGVRLWGTFYGGSEDDTGWGCCTSDDSAIYMTGKTTSASDISTPGSHQSFNAGFGDAFLVKFSFSGQRLWGTYYGGLNGDESHCAAVDTNENIYICGYTGSSENISTPGCHQYNYGGFGDVFIGKFNSDGVRQWGTYYGGIMVEASAAHQGIIIDDSCFVFCFGYTNSTDSIATDSAFQTTLSGDKDAFLAKLTDQGIRIWGTYYGGPAFDDASSAVSDNCGHQYLLGTTQSLTGISTPGSYQPVYNGNRDIFLVKMTDCMAPDTAGQISGPVSVCANTNVVIYTVPVILRATGYVWNLPPGFTISNGENTHSITVNMANNAVSGFVSVYGTSCCDDGVPSSIAVTVHPLPVPGISGNDSVCEGASAFFYAEPGQSSYQWVTSPGGVFVEGGTSADTSATVIWNVTGSQWISVNYTDTNGCSGFTPAMKNVEVSAGSPVDVIISESQNTICAGTPVTFTATPTNPGSSPVYQWKVNAVNTGTNSPLLTYSPLNGDQVQCILTSSNTVCTSNNPASSNIITMIVSPILPVSILVLPSQNPVCAGTSVTYSAIPTNGGTAPSYQWKVNGINTGTNSMTYSYIPLNSDVVTCTLTSSETCTTGNPATSNPVSMTVNPNLSVSVTVAILPNPVCTGLTVTCTAIPVNPGSTPVYQWQVNGVKAGLNSPVFTYIPSDGDLVSCTLTSSEPCAINNPVSSIQVPVSILPVPAVTFIPCFDTITMTNARLTRLKGGIPLGGTYSGPGVMVQPGEYGFRYFFNPSLAGPGMHAITYHYTNEAGCEDSSDCSVSNFPFFIFNCGDNLTDIRDGHIYPTVQIGTQCWMAVELNFGSEILPSVHQRDNCIAEKYCPDASPVPCALGPVLYQWDEIMNYQDAAGIRDLCPPGWHVPSENDWNTLFSNWSNNAFAGAALKYTGFSGFNALLTGVFFFNRDLYLADSATFYWSSTSHGPNKAWAHAMNKVNYSVSLYPAFRSNAFAIRCLRD